ncbi:Hypothetical predicted protein, partial [Olea europaea subsp. europaea]
KVDKLKTTKKLWKKLEDMYLLNSTLNKLYLIERFFNFEMDLLKDLDDNLNVFKKLVQDIVNCDETVSENYKAIILLNSILDSYKKVKNVIKYGRDTLTPGILIHSLRSKEIGGESSSNRWKKKGNGRCRSKSRTKARKYYDCGNTGHFIKDCHKEK